MCARKYLNAKTIIVLSFTAYPYYKCVREETCEFRNILHTLHTSVHTQIAVCTTSVPICTRVNAIYAYMGLCVRHVCRYTHLRMHVDARMYILYRIVL